MVVYNLVQKYDEMHTVMVTDGPYSPSKNVNGNYYIPKSYTIFLNCLINPLQLALCLHKL